MRLSALVLALASVLPALADPAPQLTVRVDSSNERASSLVARYLESVAVEKPSAFHPFISFLVANKFAPPVELKDPAFATKTGLDGKKIKSRYAGHNPIFTRLLLPNETFTLLDTGLQRSRLARSRGEIELHRLALAAGHADEIVELMRGVWERREVEIAELLEASGKPTGRACESWIDVKGVKVCGVEKFWQTVGAKAKVMHGPIKIVAKGEDPMDIGLDKLLPAVRDRALPFVVLYATPEDEEFPALYDLLSTLAQPKFGAPRIQFAVRWKPHSKDLEVARPIPLFSAKLEVKEGSVASVDAADISELGLRATTHILKSADPLATLVSLAANLPIITPQLSTLEPYLPDDLAATIQAHPVEPSFTINGVAIPFDKIEPLALIRHLRAERPALHQIEELHKDLTYRVAREAMMASGLTEAEEVQGRAEKNLIKPSRANPLKIVNLVDATEGLPLKFVRASYIEGVGLDEQEDVDRVDPPANTTIYVVADLDSRDGRKLVQEALKLIDTHTGVRISFVHNPAEHVAPAHPYHLSSLLYNLISAGTFREVFPAELSAWLTFDIDEEGPEQPLDEMWTEDNPMTPFVAKGSSKEEQEKAVEFWKATAPFVERAGLKAGGTGIIINGRVVDLRGVFFPANNFRLLYQYELERRIKPVVESLRSTVSGKLKDDRVSLSQVYAMATSIVSKSLLPVGSPVRSRPYASLPADYPSFVAGGRAEHALYEIGVVVDPVSELAQRWAPILQTLSTLTNVIFKVYLSPSAHQVSGLVNTVYTASFPSGLAFDDAQELIKPSLSFAALPEEAVVALSVDVSEYGTLSQVSGDEVKEVQLQRAREVLFEFRAGPGPDAADDEELLPPPEEVEEAVEDESYKLRLKDEL